MASEYDALLEQPSVDQKSPYDVLLDDSTPQRQTTQTTAVSENPSLHDILFKPEYAQNLRGAIQDVVGGIPGMVTQTGKALYDAAKIQVGTPEQTTEAVADIAATAKGIANQTVSDVQSPLGSRENIRGLAQLGMMAAPAIGGLSEILRPASEIPPVQAPITEAISKELPTAKEPVPEQLQPKVGEQPNAIEPSNAQIQGGETPLGVEERPGGAVPQPSDSDNAIREAQGTAARGEVPGTEEARQRPEAQVATTTEIPTTPAEKVPFVEGSPEISGEIQSEQAKASARQIVEPTEPIQVKPLAALKGVYQAAEKAGTAGYTRGFAEARAEGQSAIAQIKNELAVADRWMAGDQEQVRQNMVEFVNKTLPPAERGRYVGAITRALRRPPIQAGEARSDPGIMYRHAFNVMRAIENRSEEVYRTGIVNDIKDTISNSLNAPGIDVGYRRQLKAFAEGISTTKPSESTLGRLKSMQEFVDKERAAGREPGIPQEHLDQLSTLTRLPLRDMPVNALEQLQSRINNLVDLGRTKAKLLERQWAREKEISVKELQESDATPIESRSIFKPQPTERLTTGQKFLNAVSKTINARLSFEQAIAPVDEIYDHLDGSGGQYNGWASRNVKGKLDLAFNEREAQRQPVVQESRRIIKQYGLKTPDLETIQTKAIINMIGRERLQEMGVRSDILDRIENTPLTKGQQAYHDYIRGQYDAVGKRIQDVAHRLYQQDMGIVKNYVPLERDWSSFSEKSPPEPLVDPSVGDVPFNEQSVMRQLQRDVNPKIISRTEQGFLKDRVEGAKTSVKLNAQDVFERHLTDALHFVNSQPTLKMLGEIVRTPEFAAKYGKTGQNIILDNLDTVANNGYVGQSGRIKALDWIRNSTSKGAVGFRVASNFVHTSQLPFAMNHAGGVQWWGKGLQLALTPEGQVFLRSNAAETYIRSGGEPAQAEVEAFSKFGKAGFFVARNIDKLNSQATFLGRYAKEMSQKGVSVDNVLNAPVDKDVQSLALRRMHRAVASPLSKDLPQMTSRGALTGGNVSVARSLNQFRNIFFDNYSNIRHDILRVGVDKARDVVKSLRDGEISQGVKSVGDFASHEAAITAAVLSSIAMETAIKLYTGKGIRAGMSALTGVEPPKQKEEKTYLGELLHHAINRIPFAGQFISAIRYGETGIPTIDAIVKPLHEVGTYLQSAKPETKGRHLTRAASGAATVLGVPGSSQAIEAFEPSISKQLGKVLPDTSKHKESKKKNEYGFSIRRESSRVAR